jgi:hypothetical protein
MRKTYQPPVAALAAFKNTTESKKTTKSPEATCFFKEDSTEAVDKNRRSTLGFK